MVKKGRGGKSGHSTLKKEILKMLEKVPEKRLAVSDLKRKLGVKRNAYRNGRFYPSHFYKTARNLENEGKVSVIPERIPRRLEFRTVLVLEEEKYTGPRELEPISNHLFHPSEIVRKQAAVDFQILCSRKRIVVSTEFLNLVENALTNKNYADTWPSILQGLWSILVNAKTRKDAQTITDLKALERVMIKIASSSSGEKDARGLAIEFLGRLETRLAMDFVFEMLAKTDVKRYEELKGHLIQALVHLSPVFELDIRENIYALLKNESTRSRGEFISEQLRQRVRW